MSHEPVTFDTRLKVLVVMLWLIAIVATCGSNIALPWGFAVPFVR